MEFLRRGGLVVVGMPPSGRRPRSGGAIVDQGLRILGSKAGSARPNSTFRTANLYRQDRLLTSDLWPPSVDRDQRRDRAAEGGRARPVVML
jgi:hypothetical protein